MFTGDGRVFTLGVRGGGSNRVSMISVIMRIMCTLVIMWCNLYGELLFGDPLYGVYCLVFIHKYSLGHPQPSTGRICMRDLAIRLVFNLNFAPAPGSWVLIRYWSGM